MPTGKLFEYPQSRIYTHHFPPIIKTTKILQNPKTFQKSNNFILQFPKLPGRSYPKPKALELLRHPKLAKGSAIMQHLLSPPLFQLPAPLSLGRLPDHRQEQRPRDGKEPLIELFIQKM